MCVCFIFRLIYISFVYWPNYVAILNGESILCVYVYIFICRIRFIVRIARSILKFVNSNCVFIFSPAEFVVVWILSPKFCSYFGLFFFFFFGCLASHVGKRLWLKFSGKVIDILINLGDSMDKLLFVQCVYVSYANNFKYIYYALARSRSHTQTHTV